MTRRPKPLPRLSREGFEPAGPDRRVTSGMFFPKPRPRAKGETIVVPRWQAGNLGPDERRALREIAATGDVLHHGGKAFIVAPVSPATMDTLAAFEADLVDREPEHDDGDGSLYDDPDREPDVDHELEPESMSSPEFDPDKPVSRPTRIPGALG